MEDEVLGNFKPPKLYTRY